MPIYKGNTKIVKLYKGTTQIVKRYKGTNIIYSASRLPITFQEVEYIESTGTQYIDTGFNAQNGFKIKMNFQLTQSSIGRNCIFGLNGNANESFFRVNSSTTYSFWANTQGSSGFIYDTFVNNQIYSIECVFDSSSYLKINNVEIKRLITTKSFGNNSIPLLAEKDISTSNMTSYSTCRLYKCEIYNDNDTLVRDLVPCYRKADNVAGLYDLVNGVFYTNAGTGSFIVGGNV